MKTLSAFVKTKSILAALLSISSVIIRPKGSTETAGFGFKGGGYYEHNMQYGGFNPHSPIGNRNFGSWAGGARSLAYGSRFARTAIQSTMIR